MPTFGLAALWNASARPERVRELVEELGKVLSSSKPAGLVVALRAEEANLELKVDVPGYPRAAVEQLAREVKQSGGTLVELWRLPKAERDTFRAEALSGPESQEVESYAQAAQALAAHLAVLAKRGPRPAGPPPGPEVQRAHSLPPSPTSPAAPPPPPPPPDPEDNRRRGRRFPVALEMEFRTELDFVREHAINISNGGLFVRTSHRPPLDSVVKVNVKLPNGEWLHGEAMVMHVMDDPYKGGVGLAFVNEDPVFAETLDRYLASLAGAP